jgi:hypothetical protein
MDLLDGRPLRARSHETDGVRVPHVADPELGGASMVIARVALNDALGTISFPGSDKYATTARSGGASPFVACSGSRSPFGIPLVSLLMPRLVR